MIQVFYMFLLYNRVMVRFGNVHSETEKIKWKEIFESTWNLISKENDYT